MLFAAKRYDISDQVLRTLKRAEQKEQLTKKQLKLQQEKDAKEDAIRENPEMLERQKILDDKKLAREKALAEKKAEAEEKRKLAEEAKKKEAVEDINNGGAVIEVDGKKVIIIDQKGDVERLIIHEDRHLFFREVLKKNPKLAGQLSVLITNKLNTLNNETKTFIDELMKGYKSKGLTEAQISEELIMQFGDALLNDNVVIGFIIYKY